MAFRTVTGWAAGLILLAQASAASAAPPPAGSGVASNRAALGLPITATAACAPATAGVRASCAAPVEADELHPKGTSIVILLAAVAAVGLGIAVIVSNHHSRPLSP